VNKSGLLGYTLKENAMFDDPIHAVVNSWMIIQTIAAVWLGWICIRSIWEETRQD